MSIKQYRILNPLDSVELNKFLDELESAEYVSFDLETNSKDEKVALPIGVGITYYTDEGYYIPLRKWNKEAQTLDALITSDYERDLISAIHEILINKKLIGHNLVYDVAVWFHSYNLNLTDAVYADTILMKHLIDEERPFGLKEIAEKYKEHIGFTEEEAANQEQLDLKQSVIDNGGKWTKENKDIYKADMEIIGTYCIADTDLSLKLFEYFENRLAEENLTNLFYRDEVMPLYRTATIPMKLKGIYIDVPYFKSLEKEVEGDIIRLTNAVFDDIRDDIEPFVHQLLDIKIKTTRTGKFAERVMQFYNLPIPTHKRTGKPTLAISELKPLLEAFPNHPALIWITYRPQVEKVPVTEDVWVDVEIDGVTTKKLEKVTRHETRELPDVNAPYLRSKDVYAIKKAMFVESNPELPEVFNLSSNDHLSWLVFDRYKQKPVNFTNETEKPKVDKDSLELYSHLPFMANLLELKKQEKLLSTYVKPILEKHHNGWLYPSMLQFGTVSGRYSCAGGLNLQTLPADDKRIKKGFIAPSGYKIVGSDFSALEPRLFSEVSNDPGLKQVWVDGLDLYSQIAIDVFHLDNVSAKESDENYVKKVYPEMRQTVKTFCFDELTLIETSAGWKYIKDVNIGDQVLTKFGFKKITNKICSERTADHFITTKGSLFCTDDHKIWSNTDKAWKESRNFAVGELVEIVESPTSSVVVEEVTLPIYSNASFKNKAELPLSFLKFNKEWAYTLGAFLGDGVGSYTKRKTFKKRMLNSHLISSYVGICGLEQDNVCKHFSAYLEKMGYSLSLSKKVSKKSGDFLTYLCHDFELVKVFQETFKAFAQNGIDGRKNLRIQPFVFNSPLEVKLAFIAGLCDTDGYLKHHHAKVNPTINICSKSKEFASDLLNLFNSIGVDATFKCSFNKPYQRDYYLVNVTSVGAYKLKNLGLHHFMKVDRKKLAIEKAIPPKLTKFFKPKLLKIVKGVTPSKVVDITVEDVHEFVVNTIRVHNCLAVPYGANEYRIAGLMGVSPPEAKAIIDRYLNAYPELKKYMTNQEIEARKYGYVKTKFGRVRHLPDAKALYATFSNTLYNKRALVKRITDKEFAEKTYYKFRTCLNNAKNFPIQGMAAHVCNAAMIDIAESLKSNKIDGWVCLTVHDEIILIVKEAQAKQSADLLRTAMQDNWVTRALDVPILAEPQIADNMADAK